MRQLATATIGELKHQIATKLGLGGKSFPPANQRLLLSGHELSPDSEKIGNVENIEDGATIHLFERQHVIDQIEIEQTSQEYVFYFLGF